MKQLTFFLLFMLPLLAHAQIETVTLTKKDRSVLSTDDRALLYTYRDTIPAGDTVLIELDQEFSTPMIGTLEYIPNHGGAEATISLTGYSSILPRPSVASILDSYMSLPNEWQIYAAASDGEKYVVAFPVYGKDLCLIVKNTGGECDVHIGLLFRPATIPPSTNLYEYGQLE